MILWLPACGGGGASSNPSTPPATVLIAVSEFKIKPAIGDTQPSGVFVEVHYVLANGSDEDIRVSQGDLTMVMPDGAVLRYSKPGIDAWAKSPWGYELTDTILLKPGGMPRPWVSIFDAPQGGAVDRWTFRYKNELPVDVPAPSTP